MLTNDAIVSFLTTFFGAFLALGLTYFYDKYKAKEIERSDRHKVLATVSSELTRNLETIKRTIRDEADYIELQEKLNKAKVSDIGYLAVAPDIRLDRAALDTAIFSGKLFLLNQNTLETLSENYRRVDVINRCSDELRSMARVPLTKDYFPMFQNLIGVTRGYMDNLSKSIPETTEKLKNEP